MPPLPASFNSLFWRLFCGLIAVILATAAAVWTAAYVVQSQVVAKLENSLSLRYGGQRAVETAFIMHRYAGEAGLVEWLLSDAKPKADCLRNDKNRGRTERTNGTGTCSSAPGRPAER